MRLAIQVSIILSLSLHAADSPQKEAWQDLVGAIQAGGEPAANALEMLGAIGHPASRALLESTLRGNDAAAISHVAAGLTPAQCALYLGDLDRAVRDPEVQPKTYIPRLLEAIARAGNAHAAEMLVAIADRAIQPMSGVAFGLLAERMRSLAEPLLIRTVASGQNAWSRTTAAFILCRIKDPASVAAFRGALHDPDEGVRIAAALGLAQLGHHDGEQEIETAANEAGSEYQTEAVVALATLGRPEALEQLQALVTSSDEAVRGRAVWAIARSGSARLKEFAYRLGLDRQPIFRGMLADRLFDVNDPRDVATLLEMIASDDEMSQLIAAGRLLGTKLSVRAEPVIDKALASNNVAARGLALKIAAGQPSLSHVIAAHLGNPDPAVEVAALSAIADLHQDSRFGEVKPYLASGVRSVSAAAARTLAALNPAAAKRIFTEGLGSTNANVRIHSAAMLLAIAAHS